MNYSYLYKFYHHKDLHKYHQFHIIISGLSQMPIPTIYNKENSFYTNNYSNINKRCTYGVTLDGVCSMLLRNILNVIIFILFLEIVYD